MADDNRDKIRAAAAAYRDNLVSTGAAQQRATAEATQASRLEDKAAGLRTEAAVDDQKAHRRLRSR